MSEHMTNPATSGSEPVAKYADASQRALEAYDTLPADSQYSTDPEERVRMALEGSDTVFDETEVETIVRAMTPLMGHGVINNNTFLPKVEPVPYYELEVQMTVRLPDGVTIEYREAIEKTAADDYDLDEVSDLAEQVHALVDGRIKFQNFKA